MHASSFTEKKIFFSFHFRNVEVINELLSVILFNFYNINYLNVGAQSQIRDSESKLKKTMITIFIAQL